MEKNVKKPYEYPTMEIVELRSEGIVCASGERSGYGFSNELE